MGFVSSIKSKVYSILGNDYKDEIAQDNLKKGFERVPYGSMSADSGLSDLTRNLENSEELLRRYSDYEEMDSYPEVGSALDIFADDATIPDMYHNKTIWATSENRTIRIILNDLLHNRIEVEENIWNNARMISWYGNNPAEILLDTDGVVGLNFLPVPTVKRIETNKGTLVGFVQDMYNITSYSVNDVRDAIRNGDERLQNATVFEPWEIVHFRLMGKDATDMYGTSVLDSARWIFKRLAMLEDNVLVQKLQNSAKFAFYVDVGDSTANEALAYVNQVRQMYQKRRYVNQSTSKVDFRANPMAPPAAYWIPTRAGNDSTRIDVVSPPDISTIEELEYFREKLFAAIKVPRSYIGFGGDTNRASLSQEDARFARTVMRIQRAIKNGYKQICRIHLAALGIDPDTVKFGIKMCVPSSIFQMAQIELRGAQADNASSLEEYFEKEWIMEHVFDFSKEDSAFAVKAKDEEIKRDIERQYEVQAQMLKKFPQLAGADMPDMEGAAAEESKRDRRDRKLMEVINKLPGILEEQRKYYEKALEETARRSRRGRNAIRKQRL